MYERFIDHIEKEHLLAPGQTVLLAVSGGRDSVTLCHLVAKAGYRFAIAHCNFHLRPGDCDRDEAFVRRLADRYGVALHVAEFDTVSYAASHGISIEEAARNQRYGFFEEVRAKEGYACIATAHHRDDSIETFFINLLRGTGIAGLKGIPPRNGHVVRPMLPFGRDEIDRYVEEHNLEYVDDYTNAQPLYMRNRIRLQLLPLLRQLQPSFDSIMQDNLSHFSDASRVYSAAVESVRSQLVVARGDGFSIDIEQLKTLEPIATYLFELIRPFGFGAATAEQILSCLDGQSGKVFNSSTHSIVLDRGQLLISPRVSKEVAEYGVDILKTADGANESHEGFPDGIAWRVDAVDSVDTIRLERNEAWFDADRLRFPLKLRHWRSGDRFAPFGMQGSRLVSDLFSDQKLSLIEKDRVWILCDSADEILWVAGLRASRIAPVTKDTRRIMKWKITKL